MSNKIKLIIVASGMCQSGGVERFYSQTHPYLMKAGFSVRYLITGVYEMAYVQELRQLGYQIDLLQNQSPRRDTITVMLRFFRSIYHYFRLHRASHIHFHACSYSMLVPLLLAKICQRQAVRYFHAHVAAPPKLGFIQKFRQEVVRFFCSQWTDVALAASSVAAQMFFTNQKMVFNRYHLIANGIDASRFRYRPQKRLAMRKQLGLENYYVIGYVGRLAPEKNIGILLALFSRYYQVDQTARLLLVGNGEALTALQQQIKQLSLEHVVIFVGAQMNPEDYEQAMDVFVMPSQFEGLGTAAIEAQAVGLPCLLSCGVPQEAMLTTHCCRLSLDQPKRWIEQLQVFKALERTDGSQMVVAAGFEVGASAENLCALYREDIQLR